ncbi:hypothetical protein VM98_29120 [Streptomyces rubellomurinus subsp. indigoferus]|nr:hypothetical protein VM98_29120 [Streptomyces rubellomurinus subsp. indigoferus]
MSSGDGTDLVGAVVAALAQAASSAAGAAGTALGAEATSWVLQGLGRLPRWAQAAQRVESAPEDDAARQQLADAVGELLSLQPELAERLAERLAAGLLPTASPLPPAPPAVTVGEGAHIGGAGQTAVGGSGHTLVGGDVHNNVVNKRGSTGVVVATLIVVAALIALGIHFLGGSGSDAFAARLPDSVEGDALRASSASDWEATRADLVKGGLENPQTAAYGIVPEVSTSMALGGDDHAPRWVVYLGDATSTFQRTFAESQKELRKFAAHPEQVPTSLPGTMYCFTPETKNSNDASDLRMRSCSWLDDKHAIIVYGRGNDTNLMAGVIERIYHGTER